MRRQLVRLLGFNETYEGVRFARMLAIFARNALALIEKKGCPILLPSGQQTDFFPAGIIADVATAVVSAALDGTLH